jgi:hypothetical protein
MNDCVKTDPFKPAALYILLEMLSETEANSKNREHFNTSRNQKLHQYLRFDVFTAGVYEECRLLGCQ